MRTCNAVLVVSRAAGELGGSCLTAGNGQGAGGRDAWEFVGPDELFWNILWIKGIVCDSGILEYSLDKRYSAVNTE